MKTWRDYSTNILTINCQSTEQRDKIRRLLKELKTFGDDKYQSIIIEKALDFYKKVEASK